jgi:hypothetical protein
MTSQVASGVVPKVGGENIFRITILYMVWLVGVPGLVVLAGLIGSAVLAGLAPKGERHESDSGS